MKEKKEIKTVGLGFFEALTLLFITEKIRNAACLVAVDTATRKHLVTRYEPNLEISSSE